MRGCRPNKSVSADGNPGAKKCNLTPLIIVPEKMVTASPRHLKEAISVSSIKRAEF